MATVQSTFTSLVPGAVSRAVDDIVVAMAKTSVGAIPFGAPVFLTADGDGAEPYADGTEPEAFLGFTVRSGAKTPRDYESSEAAYEADEIMDVLTRGSIVTVVLGDPKPGDPVYIQPTVGLCAADDTGVLLPGCHFRGPRSAGGMAEVLVNTRNLL